MTPCLNWLELEALIQKLKPEIEGLFVERVIIPERNSFPNGYLKGEWTLRLTGRKQEGVLTFSIRPRHPYLTWRPGKGPKASRQATHSPFDLNLSKQLKGAKLLECQALPKERIAVLWFSEEGKEKNRLGLVLVFIPAAPEAFLVSSNPKSEGWFILARSRTIRDVKHEVKLYTPPNGSQAPANPTFRDDILATPETFSKVIEKELEAEAFEVRLLAAQKNLRLLLKQAQERFRQSETALNESKREPNWQRLGDLLKASLGNPPPLVDSQREVLDYETGKTHFIPCDPKLNIQQQVEKFFQNARRKQRRATEAQSRMDRFKESMLKFEGTLKNPPTPLNWNDLEKLERMAGTPELAPPSDTPKKKKNSPTAWLGKTFMSKDGLNIWVGRSKDENLDLTFKHARGNDLWLHVRGRPGAHVVIPLQSGKSAPLETLLDAAVLTLHYSGGSNWGKTEVDYTFKKHVKRIKDSSEASYTHNKTLIIESDSNRLKRLLEQG